ATVRVRAAQLGEAHSQYWPSLTVSGTELSEETRYPGSTTPPSSDKGFTVYGALTWKLFDFGGRHADSQAARKLLEAALGAQDATLQRILGSVVEAYFDAVTGRALLRSKAEDEEVANEILASARRRLSRGDGAQSDSLQATRPSHEPVSTLTARGLRTKKRWRSLRTPWVCERRCISTCPMRSIARPLPTIGVSLRG